MKEKLKKIFTNNSFWEYVVGFFALLITIFGTYSKGVIDGLLIDDDIRTRIIDCVNNEIINDYENNNLTSKKSLKPNVSTNNIKSGLSNFALNSKVFNYSTFTMLVSNRTYNFINNVTSGQNAYMVSNLVSFDSTNFTIGNNIYESIHCDIFILYRPYSSQYYLISSVWDNINNVSLRRETILDYNNSASSNSSFLAYFYSNNFINNSNTTFLLSSYPTYISSPTFTGDFVTADIENNSDNFIDYFFVTFGANSSDAYNAGYNAGYNDFANSNEYITNLEQAYQNGLNIGYQSGVIEGVSEYKNSQEYRDVLKAEYDKGKDDGYDIGYQARQDSVEDTEETINSIWSILEKAITSVLNVLSFEILPGIPLYICIAVPILLCILLWVIKVGAS